MGADWLMDGKEVYIGESPSPGQGEQANQGKQILSSNSKIVLAARGAFK